MHPAPLSDQEVSPSAQTVPYAGALTLDIERYRKYVEGMNLSDAQIAEMFQALWSVLAAFVDLGFGSDSVHLALPNTENVPRKTDDAA